MNTNSFIEEVKDLRDVAEKEMSAGIITGSYHADVDKICELLNIALATELTCTLRYKSHYYKAKSLGFKIASDEFLEHAKEEQGHADKLADRISQLGGSPKFSPNFILNNSHAQYKDCEYVGEMIEENMIAERIAVESYRKLVQFIGDSDPTTRRLLEDILAVEEKHLDDLFDVKAHYNQKQ